MRSKFMSLGIILMLLVSFVSSGCFSNSERKGITAGVVIGAIAGAIIGNQVGNPGQGAAIGAALGGASGGMIAQNQAPINATGVPEQSIVRCPHCREKIDVSGNPTNTRIVCPYCKQMFTT